MTIAGKNLLVCVCGGIAAYKVCHIVSHLVQQQVQVDVAMTAAARQFIGPLTFETLTARPVHSDLWSNPRGQDPQHLHLIHQCDLVLVAPATADMLAKTAHGIADDLVSTLLLAARPELILVAPAMNEAMWNNPATQSNVDILQRRGTMMIGPESGWQACRTVGMGRMSEPESIIQALARRLEGAPTSNEKRD